VQGETQFLEREGGAPLAVCVDVQAVPAEGVDVRAKHAREKAILRRPERIVVRNEKVHDEAAAFIRRVWRAGQNGMPVQHVDVGVVLCATKRHDRTDAEDAPWRQWVCVRGTQLVHEPLQSSMSRRSTTGGEGRCLRLRLECTGSCEGVGE